MTTQGPINAVDKLPWGWHFRPTGLELINNLKKKVRRQKQERRNFEPDDISEVLREIDLSQVEPWEIKDVAETCSIRAAHADEQHQFFYTQKEQKYRHGKRSNRATRRGFWKATGRDKPIYGKISPRDKVKRIIGYRKALVFYQGRAPNGTKTDWILHEYRLEKGPDAAVKDEQWVACHMFIKERNGPPGSGKDSQEELPEEHYDDISEMHHMHQSSNVKGEPGYAPCYQPGNPTTYGVESMCPSDMYVPPRVRDEFSLPHLEDETTYPVHVRPTLEVAPQPPRQMPGRTINFGPDLFRPMGRIPSFNNELITRSTPGRLTTFDDRLISDRLVSDLLFGIYAEQTPQQQCTNYQAADDNLW